MTGTKRVVRSVVETYLSSPEVIAGTLHYLEESGADVLGVDAIGYGRATYDHLVDSPQGNKVVPFIANAVPHLDTEDEETQHLMDRKYANLKSRVLDHVRQDMYRGRLTISADLEHFQRLKTDLEGYRLRKLGGRIKSEDPKHSPDVSDAMLIAYYAVVDAQVGFWLGA